MPFTPVNYLHAPKQEYPYGDLLKKAMEGYELARKPKQISQEEKQRELTARLTEAKANKEEVYGGISSLSGPAREVASYELAKKLYGEDSPVTKQIKNIMDANFNHTTLLNENYKNLNATAPERYASGFGKKIIEGGRAARGEPISPLLNEQPTPEESEEYAGQYANLRTKETTDSGLRKQLNSGENMEITHDSIDPNKAFRYAGILGKAKKLFEQGKILTGQDSEEYAEFEEEMTKLGLWAKQVRQFYGDSITKGVQDDLKNLTNPQYWSLNPEIAKRKFNQLSNITKRELNTLRTSAKNPSIYRGERSENQNQPSISEAIQRNSNPENNNANPIERLMQEQERLGLKPNADVLTEENILKRAQEQKWSKEKLDFVLRKLRGQQ